MSEIEDRIRKLLALGKGTGFDGEAEAALAKAAALAARHHIDLDRLRQEEPGDAVAAFTVQIKTRRATFGERMAAQLCERYFHVRVIEVTYAEGAARMSFFGTESDILIAIQAFCVMQLEQRRRLKEYARQLRADQGVVVLPHVRFGSLTMVAGGSIFSQQRRRADAKSFIYGFYCGLDRKLAGAQSDELARTQDHSSYAVVCANSLERIDRTVDKLFPDAQPRDDDPAQAVTDPESLRAGYQQGLETVLAKGLSG